MVVGGILVLAGAVYTLLYAVSEIYPKDPSVFDEFINKVWFFL